MTTTIWPTLPVRRGFTEISNVYDLVNSAGGYICGGYVRFMVSPRNSPATAGDLDIYCADEAVYEDVRRGLHRHGYNRTYVTAVSDSYSPKRGTATPKLQVIRPRIEGRMVSQGSLQEILDNFDFSIARVGLLDKDTALVDPDFVRDETEQRLRIKNVHCPFGNMMRVIKYAEKGYRVQASDLIPLFVDWDTRGELYKQELLDKLYVSAEKYHPAWNDPDYRDRLYSLMLMD